MKAMVRTRFFPFLFLLALGSIFLLQACRAAEPVVVPLARPEAAHVPSDARPDIIKIAVYFVEREGMGAFLVTDNARVKRQDREAYYVSFPRKEGDTVSYSDFVVKVYKQNGWAEWSIE